MKAVGSIPKDMPILTNGVVTKAQIAIGVIKKLSTKIIANKTPKIAKVLLLVLANNGRQ